nr:hypothetical protein [Tanacetum cinerariifolium]
MDPYLDEGMGDVIVGEPFCKASCVEARRFDGIITIHYGDDNVTYQMVRSNLRFKYPTNEKCNKIQPLVKTGSYSDTFYRSRANPTLLNDFEIDTEGNGDPPVPDLRNIEELCQPSLNGRGGPIASIAIQATNFELKNDMIQRVQNSCQFHGLPGDDANKHLDKFLHVTQNIKVNGVTDDALCLYLFPYTFTHHATAWFDCLPWNSINTFEKMAKMFLGKYFPPSMVTKLKNEITNIHQHTLYNGLTWRHRDTINAAAGRTFMKRRPEECYDLIKNMIAHQNDWDTLAQWSESSSSITSSFNTEIAALKAEMA